MTDKIKLNDLRPDMRAVIEDVSHKDSAMTYRLGELGFVTGAVLQCVGRSPVGGMGAYLVKGAVIALRDCDAGAVSVITTE